MTAEAPPFLIAAVTGRALAESAARGGHPVVVLDCFADRDTVAAARAAAAVAKPGTMHFDRTALLSRADAMAPASGCAGLVVGAGFEGRRALLSRLAAGRTLMGNPAPVVRAVKDPRRFFPLLDRIGIRYPDVRHTPPPAPAGWLVKKAGGAGGTHVGRATDAAVGRGTYFQRLETGRVCSVLFLCDGHRALVVGVNQQWTRSVGAARPFVYAGAAGGLVLPAALERDLRMRLDALVAATGLRGLAGLDFIWRDDAWLALEVNPRPTATLDLYDADFPRGLFDAHLQACAGRLPRVEAGGGVPPRARAHAIVAAEGPWRLPGEFTFPAWCRDLPQPGHAFTAGEPVCTVHAEASDTEAAVTELRGRQRELERLIAEARAAG
ncbi:MAG: ATP-grasp domain-containing protein [Gemmatimonadota bacterium]|nr:ATP-grasp domain-containing protein [Gemmatimonadota bacterium]MDH4347270.1 ATP-grasp domain-containing protein [Gemmatimonadota bacterium]MDH5282414.1 ATP-grasp domain-containing protein [Gemmatimonadota bacterium]